MKITGDETLTVSPATKSPENVIAAFAPPASDPNVMRVPARARTVFSVCFIFCLVFGYWFDFPFGSILSNSFILREEGGYFFGGIKQILIIEQCGALSIRRLGLWF